VAWLYLLLAGLCEIFWPVAMRASDGLTRPLPLLALAGLVAASFGLLTLAIRSIPMGTAYAVWTGIGAAGIATLGILYFEEAATPMRLLSIALVVLGVAGLKLFS
jgi:quaternary ammonium compound-resistance protein SugE